MLNISGLCELITVLYLELILDLKHQGIGYTVPNVLQLLTRFVIRLTKELMFPIFRFMLFLYVTEYSL